ncbi:MAG: CcoQ/FixQ family Cbb3-type cytochrome c oxidase assembly chaperone [Saprospiraceae bacterium]|uniref:CcoQ/FixQ family Cbb3-type cytochrome c oxidase assembly chaperone n=1 Tax=Candidatus Opimibacter skivensis TaxID=2982028 RepID=A0A9D7STL0_9BACT|nr:CcoQ/FixQ family Cbb3-type cytochrome c oxidase assembly chaperone [Candidatus Opimibacter skivensis]
MKFSNYLEHITGVSIYPLVSLGLFVVFFMGVLIWSYRIDKNEIEHMENLPLND